jgi:hypothetical protein
MSTEKHQEKGAEEAASPEKPNPNPNAMPTAEEMFESMLASRESSRARWPIGMLEGAQIVLRVRGGVHTTSERNSTGEWRTIISPENIVGALPGREGLAKYPLMTITSDWHKSSEKAFAQALRRYCDLFAGQEK